MRILLVTLLCLLSITAQAEEIKGIFYQPQQSDLTIPVEQWPQIFSAAKKKGFNTLVIQWTSFGDTFASTKKQEWLKDRIIEARQADLKLIIGLSGDPEIFTRLKQPPSIVGSYFRKMNQANVELAILWAKTLPAGSVVGWYLPLEVDDRQWRSIPAREELTNYLIRQVNDLNKVLPLPVYISSFFAGNMTPKSYVGMLENMTRQSNVHFWIQNGSGTNKLIPAERKLYLDAAGNCKGYSAAGLVFELFKQTRPDQEFAAKPLNPIEMSKALKQTSPCNGDNLFFALNYLIPF
jgi:hypothetical protein